MKRCLCGVHSLFLFEGNIRSSRLTYDFMSLTNGLEILQLGIGKYLIFAILLV